MSPRVLLTALVLAIASAGPANASSALPRSPNTWGSPSPPLFTRGDAWFGAATVASVALATRLDGWAAEEAPENSGLVAVRVARSAEHLGSGAYVFPALFLVGAVDALQHRSDRLGSVARIAAAGAAAGITAGVIKVAVGRARPYETPGDQDVMRPFSGYSAFPSGHTALAFAIATGIDQETKSKWVPYVVYPLAGLVGWSRMRDQKHWSSDVVAGASVGFWTARKVVAFARRRMDSR